tara:strand:+ start:779 stop:1099 length:321 start_codon:yes stop_codon:yes gene_type:complete
MTETKHDLEKASAILAWNFLQIITPEVLNELTKQIYQIQADTDDAAEFVKEDEEGKVLFETLRSGLDHMREKTEFEDWPKGMIQLTAWMIRDLVVEVSPPTPEEED